MEITKREYHGKSGRRVRIDKIHTVESKKEQVHFRPHDIADEGMPVITRDIAVQLSQNYLRASPQYQACLALPDFFEHMGFHFSSAVVACVISFNE